MTARLRHLRSTAAAGAAGFLVAAAVEGGGPDLIFRDDFESGTTDAWSAVVGEPPRCVEGPPLQGLLDGDLGPAPPGGEEITCLEVRNDRSEERGGEIAFSGVPLPRDLDLTSTETLALVGPGQRRIAAQFDILARWGGPADDSQLPARWLEVSVPARVAATSTTRYSLRRYETPPPADDPLAVTVEGSGGPCVATSDTCTVETGLARFVLDPQSPALVEEIAIDEDDDGVGPKVSVYGHTAGAGPRLVLPGPGGDLVLDTSTAGAVTVDADSFRVASAGPVKSVVSLDGHFVAPGGASLCNAVSPAYERFGFTAVMTFVRASRDLTLRFQLRNECSDAQFEPWTDDDVAIEGASWELPFAPSGATTRWAGGAVGVAPYAGTVLEVEQARGAGTPWQRRARILLDGVEQETAESFARPFVALASSGYLVAAQMPWMRYREPQALVVDDGTLSLRFVSEPLNIGEGKAVWNLGKVSLVPAAGIRGTTTGVLEELRRKGTRELERGLLVRAPLPHVNASGVFPSLGTEATSTVKSRYVETMTQLHDETVRPGGAWDRGKVYGSLLWPEITFDPYAIGLEGVDEVAFPNDYAPSMNYWDPAGAELLEFLRTGDPKWVWDMALPAHWLQLFSAYLNIGRHQHGNRNGVAVTSGGPGCELDPDTFELTQCTADGTAGGEWDRTAFGSDDYTYDMGIELAFALRPDPAVRARFADAGRNLVGRYSIPRAQQASRERFVNQVDLTRQVIQHFEMLANCAEFVPGQTGRECHDRLLEVVDELAAENLSAGVMCQGDVNPVSSGTTNGFCGPAQLFDRLCSAPQQFMKNALMVPFLHRVWSNYGDPPGGSLRDALVEGPRALYLHGIDKQADGVSLDVFGDWAPVLECELSADGSTVLGCVPAPDSDNQCAQYQFNKPHTAALLLMAHEVDPSIRLCEIVKEAYDDPDLFTGWPGNLTNGAGWWKGAAQMMQSMVFGVGIYDTCADPAPALVPHD